MLKLLGDWSLSPCRACHWLQPSGAPQSVWAGHHMRYGTDGRLLAHLSVLVAPVFWSTTLAPAWGTDYLRGWKFPSTLDLFASNLIGYHTRLYITDDVILVSGVDLVVMSRPFPVSGSGFRTDCFLSTYCPISAGQRPPSRPP